MLDEQHQPSDEVQAVRELSEDLEPADETAAEITAGSPPPGSASIQDLTIMRVVDKATPVL
jgi:type VI protein secretion system component Hcp